MLKTKEKEVLEEMFLTYDKETREICRRNAKNMEIRAIQIKKEKNEEKKRKKNLYNNTVVTCELCGDRVTRKNLKRHYSSDHCRNKKENIILKKKILEMESIINENEKQINLLKIDLTIKEEMIKNLRDY